MLLLELPPELTKYILHLLDPESFFICLLVCKTFRYHALNSTSLLKDQLAQIPGYRERGSREEATTLLSKFQKRAVQHLKHGVILTADFHTFRPNVVLDRRNSKLFTCSCQVKKHLILVGVCTIDSTVRVYEFEGATQQQQPRLSYVIPSPQSEGDKVRYEVLKVTTGLSAQRRVEFKTENILDYQGGSCINRLSVLYRSVASNATSPSECVLISYRLNPRFGVMTTHTMEITTAGIGHPVALGITGCNTVFVALRRYAGSFPVTEICRYDPRSEGMQFDRIPIESDPYQPYDQVSEIRLQGPDAHLFSPALPIAQWTMWNCTVDNDVERFTFRFRDDVEPFRSNALGERLAEHHHHLTRVKDRHVCVNTILHVMLARHNSDCWTYIPRTGAFLLKAIQHPSECSSFDEEAIRNLRHVFVARLAGIDVENISTLGIRMAVSPQSQRIAMASWRRVLVWSVDPEAFLDPKTLPPGEEPAPGDYAYIEGAGWQYYACNNSEKEMVVLEPVELPSAGVVYELAFGGEDELWGWTDRGAVRWNFGVYASGKRDASALE